MSSAIQTPLTNAQFATGATTTVRTTDVQESRTVSELHSFEAPRNRATWATVQAISSFSVRLSRTGEIALCNIGNFSIQLNHSALQRSLERSPGTASSSIRSHSSQVRASPFVALNGHGRRTNVRFSNRPFGVKRVQTIHHCNVDVAAWVFYGLQIARA